METILFIADKMDRILTCFLFLSFFIHNVKFTVFSVFKCAVQWH